MASQQEKTTTQKFLDIHDITNNLVILKDGTVAFILAVSAMNFGLLAEQEQDAVIYTYAAMLNSLNYPIQIIIQSQTKDATQYLRLLQEQEQEASSEAKAQMIARYRQFVANLIKQRNVLDKKFFVAAPASAVELGLLTADSVLPGRQEFNISDYEVSRILEKAQSILEPRRDHLVSQFARIGLFAKQLRTQEIIKVFYTNYNPEASEGLEIANTGEYTTPLVRANFTQQHSIKPIKKKTQSQQPAEDYYQTGSEEKNTPTTQDYSAPDNKQQPNPQQSSEPQAPENATFQQSSRSEQNRDQPLVSANNQSQSDKNQSTQNEAGSAQTTPTQPNQTLETQEPSSSNPSQLQVQDQPDSPSSNMPGRGSPQLNLGAQSLTSPSSPEDVSLNNQSNELLPENDLQTNPENQESKQPSLVNKPVKTANLNDGSQATNQGLPASSSSSQVSAGAGPHQTVKNDAVKAQEEGSFQITEDIDSFSPPSTTTSQNPQQNQAGLEEDNNQTQQKGEGDKPTSQTADNKPDPKNLLKNQQQNKASNSSQNAEREAGGFGSSIPKPTPPDSKQTETTNASPSQKLSQAHTKPSEKQGAQVDVYNQTPKKDKQPKKLPPIPDIG